MKDLKDKAFFKYNKELLEKDSLTDSEFRKLITDYFLGMGYYVIDPLSTEQINKDILETILNNYPNKREIRQENREWLEG